MKITELDVTIPPRLFPIIAHIVKSYLENELEDAETIETRLMLDHKSYKGGLPMQYLMQIHDHLQLNNKVNAALLHTFNLYETVYYLAIGLGSDMAILHIKEEKDGS